MYEHNSRLTFYRAPFGAVPVGERVHIRFFAPLDTEAVVLCTENERYLMKKEWEMCGGQVFGVEFAPRETSFYTFQIREKNDEFIYGKTGEHGGGAVGSENGFQITVYTPRNISESFLESAVYQIFPDRFCPGGTREKSGIERHWGETPYYKAEQFGGRYTANDFFGGTLWGVAEKLPYIKGMGFDWIYLNPIFDTSSNHGYNTRDYRHVAASLGGDAAFDYLAARAKSLNMHIMLDGVFSHTGDDSIYFQSAKNEPDSPYKEWYTFTDTPPYYESWWGIPTLPNVREETPSYMDFMLGEDGILRQWLRRGADGWRLDVADELPDGFLDGLRRAVKAEKENAVIIGEVWEDASNKISYGSRRRYLTGYQLDSVTHYTLRNAILDFVLEKTDAKGFKDRVMTLMENYPPSALLGALCFLSGHDTVRVLTLLGDAPEGLPKDAAAVYRLPEEKRRLAKERLRVALMLLVTMPGVPCVFYGDEAGMEGYGDPFCRGTFPWGEEDGEIQGIYRSALSLRRKNTDLVYGKLAFFHAEGRALAFSRGRTAIFINGGREHVKIPFGEETVALSPMESQIREAHSASEYYTERYVLL